jgi:putative ABC transport system permease protein
VHLRDARRPRNRLFASASLGLLPALRATYISPMLAMRSAGRGATAGRERFSLRRALVSTQVALSLVLLVGALLFVRSLHNLLTTEAGFQSEGLLTINIDFSKSQYPKERRYAIYRELSDRLSALAGAISVAHVGFTPVSLHARYSIALHV